PAPAAPRRGRGRIRANRALIPIRAIVRPATRRDTPLPLAGQAKQRAAGHACAVTAQPQREPRPGESRPPARRAAEWADRTVESVKVTVRDTVRPVAHRGPAVLLRRTWSKAWADRIFGLSAEAGFWQLLSVPPLF